MTAAEPAAEGAWVAVTVPVDTAGGGGVPAGLTRGDGVSDSAAIPAGTVALLIAEGVAAKRGLGVGVGVSSATAMTRGVGVAEASGVALATGVALASAGSVGSDCGVIMAWAMSGIVSVVARREPTATATTMVTSSTLAAKSTSVDVRHALSAANSFAVRSARSDARRIGVALAATSHAFFTHPATTGYGHSH
jgi:hypothetical protein